MKKSFVVFFAFSVICFASSIIGFIVIKANENVEVTTHIESYNIQEFELDDSNLYEETGYKKVNAITEIIEEGNQMTSKVSVIEDHFDSSGEYVKTIVRYDEFIHNEGTGSGLAKTQEKEVHTPLTLFVSDTEGPTELTTDEKDQIKTLITNKIINCLNRNILKSEVLGTINTNVHTVELKKERE